MIRLGTRDRDDIPQDRRQYFSQVHEASMLAKNAFRGEKEGEWLGLTRSANQAVSDVQRFLQQAGFFPFGKIDGLCGYRTASSMRLFQEYVRSVEGDTSIGYADGIFGRKSFAQVKRWQANAISADWLEFGSDKPSPEHKKWMRLLRRVKAHYRASPTALLKKVEAFGQASDTRKVSDWDLEIQSFGRRAVSCPRPASLPFRLAQDQQYETCLPRAETQRCRRAGDPRQQPGPGTDAIGPGGKPGEK